MIVSKPRNTRSTTLLSGSSYSKTPSVVLCLRKSLTDHWTLIEPVTHKPRYHVHTPDHPHPTAEIRRGSSEGPIIGTVHQEVCSSRCQLQFLDGSPNIEIGATMSLPGRHKFKVNGRKLYWKRDQICRETVTRRVFAETDGDMLLVYEGAEEFLDVIVASFLAMKFKHQSTEGISWFKVPSLC